MTDIQQVRKGSTPILILSILEQGPRHGYAIMRELETRSQGYFTMTAALLYPTLHQMEQEGFVESLWEGGSGQRRRKMYAITPAGRQRLSDGQSEWKRFFDQFFGLIGNPTETRKAS